MSKRDLLGYVRKIAIQEFHEKEDELNEAFKDTVGIAYFIAKVAHYEQERDNGAPYFLHPLAMCSRYRAMTNYESDDFDPYELQSYGIPFYGVQEVCILHDVLEDWMAKIEDIEEVYADLGYVLYFQTYIKEPLMLITHDKSVDYDTYMQEVLKNPTSALVKLLDLDDNLHIFGLGKYGDKEDERMHRYVGYRKLINDKYQFVEKFAEYRKAVRAF